MAIHRFWFLAISCALAASCTKSGKGDHDKKRGRGDNVAPVVVVEASRKILAKPVTYVAALTGRNQADVYAKVTGRVAKILKSEGARVAEGDVLLRVDRSEPGESYLTTPVVSPIGGWLGRLIVTSVGEQVTPQNPVATVVDDRTLRVQVSLPIAEWILIEPKTAVTIEVGGQKRSGKIVAIARAGDPASGRGKVTIDVANEDLSWRSGMVARVTFALKPTERMFVPTSALVITDAGSFVFTVAGDKAKKIPIQFHLIDNDTAEIVDGLADASLVVTVGANMLSDEAAVNVVETRKL